jgi:hypothetical protein
MKYTLLLFLCLVNKIVFAQDQKIFLLTDRENYAPGDTVWMQAKLINTSDRSFSKTNDILYISIEGQKKSKEIKSQFVKGVCNTQLFIPRSFKSGIFTFQARTKYLEQFGSKAYFTKKIKVNVLGVPSTPIANVTKPKTNPLRFFPEGGNYLSAFSAKLGFKLDLPKAELKGNKGQILDETGAVVANFYPDGNGLGHVSFMPKPYEKYKGVFTTKLKKYEADLPEASGAGVSLSVDNVLTRSAITVTLNNANNMPDSVLILVVKNDSVVFKNLIVTENQQYKISINQNTFEQEGLAQVLLLNNRNETLAERWVYISRENYYELEKEILSEKVGVQTNETLSLTLKDQNDMPLVGVPLTVKITKAEKDIDFNKSLKAYLNFDSEIPEMQAKIDTFFELSATAAAFNLDNILLVNKPFVKTKTTNIRHQENFTLNAKVFRNGYGLPSERIKLFIKDKYSIYSYDLTSDDSCIISLSGNWYDSLTVFATDLNYKTLELGFEENDFVPNKPKLPLKKPPLKAVPATPEVAILKTDSRRKTYSGKTDFVIKPKSTKDTNSNIKDWIALKLKKTKIDTLLGFDISSKLNASSSGFYIDGMYVSPEFLNLINQKDIAQVDVLTAKDKLVYFGKKEGMVFNILSKSKKAKEQGLAIQNTSKWLAFEPKINFPIRNRTVSGTNTILWAPDQITDKNGKLNFKLPAHNKLFPYVLSVQGIDKNGNVIETDMPLR